MVFSTNASFFQLLREFGKGGGENGAATGGKAYAAHGTWKQNGSGERKSSYVRRATAAGGGSATNNVARGTAGREGPVDGETKTKRGTAPPSNEGSLGTGDIVSRIKPPYTRSKWDKEGDNTTSEEDTCPKGWVWCPHGDSDKDTPNPATSSCPRPGERI